MGKVTGFLEYSRENNPAVEPQQRISGFQEFHTELSEKQRREQGGRCMNCGVPFCQSAFGCPLHNLIPEWNDEIYSGNWSHALARLLKTNSFTGDWWAQTACGRAVWVMILPYVRGGRLYTAGGWHPWG